MYHVELRQFPHNFCRFNLTEAELREAILDAWARGDWIELGERKWSPHQANLTVLEGPRIPVAQLSMGRGWRNAGRQGRDVTEQLLAMAQAATQPADAEDPRPNHAPDYARAAEAPLASHPESRQDLTTATASASDLRLMADSLGLEVLAMLTETPVPLATVWRATSERYPERPLSDCLKLAEYATRSILDTRLAVVLLPGDGGEAEPCSSAEQIQRVLQAIDSWSGATDSALIRKA
jgi:hypothetical protein